MTRNSRTRLLKTSTKGFVAGVAGAWAMIQFTRLWNTVLTQPVGHEPKWHRLRYSPQEWDATSRLAEAIAWQGFGRRLSAREAQAGATFLHYAIGGTVGALYAVVAQDSPRATRFFGTLFGVSVWLAADEVLMPAFGISHKLNDYSYLMQANALGEHIAYGITTEALRRSL